MTAMTLKTSEGAVVTDPGERAEVFNNFFSDVFTSDNGTCSSVVERIGGDGLSTVTYLSGRSHHVAFGGKQSAIVPSLSGVPQGSLLGPLYGRPM